jgi:N-ethylmaleimide reductase
MSRNPRFDVLFEPVRIGPVTAPNRFYQVPHASGMTNALPQVRAAFRGVKAEGGWGVVCTGAVSIHPSSDDSPLPFASLWDDKDIRAHALMTDAVHEHGALAGIELWHGGACTLNRTSRLAPLSPSGMPWLSTHLGFMGNLRPRAMDTGDIGDLLRWQAAGARRAMQAGFDIVYVYAGMGYLPYEFLLPEYNHRTDAYGGPIENRARLMLEVSKAVAAEAGAERTGIRISPVTPANDVSDSNPQPLFDHIVDHLNALKLVYIHVIEGATGGPRDIAPFDYGSLRKRFKGAYVANNGYDLELANKVLSANAADLIAFGKPFISNPDLVERLKRGAPLNAPDKATFYGGGARGYTDYPALGEALDAAQ